jgi:hypothetical protein
MLWIISWRNLNNESVLLQFNPGGLNSQEQSRSRSRSLYLSKSVFKTCWDFLDGQDQLLKVSRLRVSIKISTKNEILGHKPCRYFIFWTVETSLNSRDQFLKPVKIFSMVEINFYKCRDQESWSIPLQDKLKPPGLLELLSSSSCRNNRNNSSNFNGLLNLLQKISF